MTRRSLVLVVLALLFGAPVAHADISNDSSTNAQEGDNENESDQSGSAESGDAVAGQVVGVQSSGDASVDATNTTRDSSATSGDADGSNVEIAFVGQDAGGVEIDSADVANGSAGNVQDGDNESDSAQSAETVSGDAVAGQVAGVTTAPGGTADLVLSNLTEDVEAESGDAEFDNAAAVLAGLFGGFGDDGGSGLVLSISNAQTVESGTLTFTVSVTRTARSKSKTGLSAKAANEEPLGVHFCYETRDGSATHEGFSGSQSVDYFPEAGCDTIGGPAETKASTTITIETSDDDSSDCGQGAESTETMNVIITSASVPVADGNGVGTIVEGPC